MMETKFTLRPEDTVFIPNGINTDYYVPHIYDREKTRHELGIADDEVVMGFSGRLDPVKNIPFLLDVFLRCARKDLRCKFVFIGDGPEREFIEQFASAHELQDRIIVTGRKPTILNYLRALDVFVLTSFHEQMPMSMLEAMSVGVPVVVSAVGEIPSILYEQEAGFCFPLSEGVEVFVDACLTLRDPYIRQKMGESARKLVFRRFQERTMIQSYIDLFSQIERENAMRFS